ncbi:MAG TPA: hypothetical protein VML75_28680, partial [Kofleriaceae bacterium]|nr:hypothetical protein [Kofleriaceae bacterium]
MKFLVIAIALLIHAGLIRPAVADERPGRVAVLPFITDEGLAIYAMPAAEAVAKRLRAGGLAVDALTLTGPVPAQVGLVVDGRITRSGKQVTLEARVRDPRRGRVVIDTIATDTAPLAEIDRLAEVLAQKLAVKLAAALETQARLAALEARTQRLKDKGPIRGPAMVITSQPSPEEQARENDARPRMLVFQAGGDDGEIVTRFGYWLANRLGYRAVPSTHEGVPPGPTVIAELQRTGAELALMIDVKKVDLEWDGVLSARGRVRVVLVDRRRQVLFDRVARTGTLVGSRGDGPDALVHYIAEQTIEIVLPHL